MKKIFLASLLALGTGSLLPAQVPFVAYGELMQTGMISVCWSPGTHFFKYTNLQITAAPGHSPNLSGLVGKYVKIEGTYTYAGSSDPICPLKAQVTKVTAVTDYLYIKPDPNVSRPRAYQGTNLNFQVFGQPGAAAVLLLGPDFKHCTPIGNLGALYLDIFPPNGYLFIAGTSVINSSGVWAGAIPIPVNPALYNKYFRFQPAMLIPSSPVNPNLLNAVHVQTL